MTKLVAAAMLCAAVASAADPVRTAWIVSPAAARYSPEVHAVSEGQRSVIVRSAGVSLRYFGPLQPAPVPAETVREFQFEIPLHPEPETARHARVPAEVIGAFVNGLPIYNHFEALSWNGANLWHYDAVALNDNGMLTATGHARPALTHPAPAGLLEQLIPDGSKHSPLIGFGLDGYPVYGPWGYGDAGLKRMRSSYRLRSITHRHNWPDGTALTPEQYGPEVSAAEPLGTFAEDYEFVEGAGDLDAFNGRFTKTPEYPDGTYAYFMTTDATGRLAYPYLIGPRFYGRLQRETGSRWNRIGLKRITLSASASRVEAGRAVTFRLEAPDSHAELIRDFEYVHEKPVHFLIASEDLAEFAHIHPELAADDSYQVSWTFAHGGRYRIWVDYSLPGEAPRVDEFDVKVEGRTRAMEKIKAGPVLGQETGSLCVTLSAAKPLRAGADIPITLRLSGSTETLEPYLGAWAHVIVIGENWRSFTHAHPIEQAPVANMGHTHAPAGPPPNEIHVVTNFPAAGLYKLWAQFQQAGQVVTMPFVLQVGAAESRLGATVIPPEAVRIQVSQHGYTPAKLEIPANHAATLAFTRDSTPSCGSEVVFPSLGIRKALPPGGTVLVPLPAQAKGEISFSCGMGMFRGMIVAR